MPSAFLEKNVTFSILLPESRQTGPGPYPVLYLLHPYGGDHLDWIVNTRLEQAISALPLIVVLPSLENSMACDTAQGDEFERFFVDELVAHIETTYSPRVGPGNTAIAGVDTGGYAALRLSLAYPYWFGVAASLSGDVCAANEERLVELPGGAETARRYPRVFGPSTDSRRKGVDLFQLAESAVKNGPPMVYLDCGGDDLLAQHNRDFRKQLATVRVRHEFKEQPGGHDWGYWDSRLAEMLTFIERSLGL